MSKKPYKRGNRLFMYDEKDAIVSCVAKMTDEEKKRK